MLPTPIAIPADRAVADLRAAMLARRVTAPPAIVALLVELAWPARDNAASAIRVAPVSQEARQ